MTTKSRSTRCIVCDPNGMGQQDFGQGRKMFEAFDPRCRSHPVGNPDLTPRTDEAGQSIECQPENQAEALKSKPSEESQHPIGINRPRKDAGDQPQNQQAGQQQRPRHETPLKTQRPGNDRTSNGCREERRQQETQPKSRAKDSSIE